jgi:N-acetyl-gamma-glutamyl-phosphate reductase
VDASRKFSVAVAGASGYAGGEFLRLAAAHPNLEIKTVTAHSNVGERLGALHPQVRTLGDMVFEPTTAQVLAGHDVVVFALPHGHSGALAKELVELSRADGSSTVFVDLGADHRLIDPRVWAKYYGSDHSGTWDYGLPELLIGSPVEQPDGVAKRKQREVLSDATLIAVPGCNVTAVTLGLQPGIAAGIVDGSQLVATLAVGYSGAGKAPKVNLLASEALGSLVPYQVGGVHRHIPEIQQNFAVASGSRIVDAASDFLISFTPLLAPVSRGILSVTSAPLAPAALARLKSDTTDDKRLFIEWLRQVWSDTYADEPFVELLPAGTWPETGSVTGSNIATVQVTFDVDAKRVVTISAIDNLVKGTAGGAIQSLNLALGLPETTGLPTNGVAP